VVVATTVCAGSPIPFDPTEVDRKFAAELTLGGLAETANHVVFDLFDHCALVVRFFVVEKGGVPRLVKTSGDRRLVPNRVALRSRALRTGHQAATTLGSPAGFRLIVAPLVEGETVTGLLEFVVPVEMVVPKANRLEVVVRAASTSLHAWHRATVAQHETRRATGDSFALGLRLAGVLARAGELGTAVRSAVELLARELKAPVVAWRTDPAGRVMRISASSGLGNARRNAMEGAAFDLPPDDNRTRLLKLMKDRISESIGGEVTLLDGGPVVFVAGGRHAELESCGKELATLLEQLPVANVSTLDFVDDEGKVRPWAHGSPERARLQDLTPREREILVMLAGGARTGEIAQRLVISEKTVKTHVQNILGKLGVSSRLEALAFVSRNGFVLSAAS
jgi:DNA-binding CsgD family transcriptional regulator